MAFDIEFGGQRRLRIWVYAAVFLAALVGLVLTDVWLKSATDDLQRHDFALHTITDDFHEIGVGTITVAAALEDYAEGESSVEAIRIPYESLTTLLEQIFIDIETLADRPTEGVLDYLFVEMGEVGQLIDSIDAGLPPTNGATYSLADDLLARSGDLAGGADLVIGEEGFADQIPVTLMLMLIALPLLALVTLIAMAIESRLGLIRAHEDTKRRLRQEDGSRRSAQRLAVAQSKGMELVATGASGDLIEDYLAETLRLETVEGDRPSSELFTMIERIRLLTSERDRVTAEMVRESTHDNLTGLYNRSSLVSQLGTIMAAECCHGPIATVFVDLRRFKITNDTYGHEIGDQILRMMATRIESMVQDVGTAARIGGSKFGVLLHPIMPERAQAVARQIIEETSRPYSVDGRRIELTVCAGVSFATDVDSDPDRLLREADTAMRHAFKTSEPMISIDDSLRAEEESRHVVEIGIRKAIEDDGIVVLYQPLVDLATGQLRGVEALARLRLGDEILTPDKFIEVAEDTGQIIDLDRRVLEIAAHQVVGWNDVHDTAIELAVNLSGAHTNQCDALAQVQEMARRSGLRPELLVVEINEGVFLDDIEAVADRLSPLRVTGIRVSIDDFGTGYSSLSYLQHLPVDILKIDQSFVARLTESSRDVALVRAIIDLAGALDLEIVAEGIEETEQRDMLTALGCGFGQGYLFDRPVDAATLEQHWLANRFGSSTSEPTSARL